MKRFTPRSHATPWSRLLRQQPMVESHNGEYVLLSDVEALLADFKEAVLKQQAQIEELKQTIFNSTGHVIK